MKIDVENINKLIEMGEKEGISVKQEDLVRFVLLFDKIVNIINSSGEEEYELKLGNYKISAKKKNYRSNTDKVTIVLKRNRN